MQLKKGINHVRRILMHNLTQRIGAGTLDTNILQGDIPGVRRILISRPNSRLGNQLLTTPLIQEVEKIFPNCKIDLFVRSRITTIILENYTSINCIIRLPQKPFKEPINYIRIWFSLRKYQYDLVINVDPNSSSGRLSTIFSKARIKLFNNAVPELIEKYDDYYHIAKHPVYNLKHFILKQGIEANYTDIPPLSLRLTYTERRKGEEILRGIVKNGKKAICIYTFATGDKCYSKEWWKNLYELMVQKYGEMYNIVEILPVENVSQIDLVPSFYSRDIREIASVIANTVVFVGADSGIMHLAVTAGIPVIGLFSVTGINQYKPYGNRNMAIDTNKTGTDGIIEAMSRVIGGVQN